MFRALLFRFQGLYICLTQSFFVYLFVLYSCALPDDGVLTVWRRNFQ